MTWTAKGSLIDVTGTGQATIALNNVAVGDLMVLIVVVNSATIFANGMSSGGVTWDAPQGHGLGTLGGWSVTVFTGKVTATGSQTASITYSGTVTSTLTEVRGFEFASSVGAWAADGAPGFLDNTNSNVYPSLTPSAAGDLYVGYEEDNGSAAGPITSPSGYVVNITANTNAFVYNLNCTAAAQAPVQTTMQCLDAGAILIKETGSNSGPNSPTVGTDLGGGTGSWTNSGNITVDDGSVALWTVV